MRRRWLVLLLVSIVILLWLAWAGARATDQPGFCGSCHFMKPFYDNWASSSHASVSCIDCHYERGFAGYLAGKLRLLGEMVRYWVGAYNVRPHSRVSDHNCLHCHAGEALKPTVYRGSISFSHASHYGTPARGITVTCTTCHSQLVQGNHLAVDENACRVCHFTSVARTEILGDCYTCHGPPKDHVLIRGIVFNHSTYLKSGVECATCHVHVTRGTGDVPHEQCFSCHVEHFQEYGKTELLHRTHVTVQKLKCTDCHSELQHGKFDIVQTLAPDCSSCHGGRHSPQEQIYIGTGGSGVEPMPDPMFLASVICSGCHQSRTPVAATASPQACVTCHGPGYDRLMQRWQQVVSEQLAELRRQLVSLPLSAIQDESVHALYEEAHKNLQLIEEDGSRGVHNIRYVNALLRRSAENIARLTASLQGRAYRIAQPLHAGEPFRCNRCHVGVELLPMGPQTASHTVHLKSSDCNACHAVQTSEHGQTFAAAQDCTQCHPSQKHMAQLEPKDCLQCHQAQIPARSEQVRFPHETHIALGFRCAACHEKVTELGHLEFLQSKRAIPKLGHDFCAMCHPGDIANNCSTCHNH